MGQLRLLLHELQDHLIIPTLLLSKVFLVSLINHILPAFVDAIQIANFVHFSHCNREPHGVLHQHLMLNSHQ